MAKEEKLRSEIEDKYKWDLTLIYENNEAWQKDYESAKNEVEKINDYKDNFLSSEDKLLEFLKYDEKINRLLGKLYYYANLNYDTDTLNDEYKQMTTKISDLYKRYNELTAFVSPSIMKTDYKVFEEFFLKKPELQDYKFLIDDIYRFKDHTLDEEKEKMLSSLSKILSYSEDTYKSLTDSDFRFDSIINEDGNEQPFSESSYSTFIRSNDRSVRKSAFNKLFNKYKEFNNTLASTFSGNLESSVVISKIRNFDSSILSSLFDDNININVYNNLINTINNNMNTMYKYYNLKKDVLKLEELHLYDVYAPLIKESNKKYSFKEAKDIVINALNILGDDYVTNLTKAFNERWIDIYHSKAKRSGAYSSGFYDTKPYLLLNYEGKLEDVSTLAHELGHSMHTYYSCKNNPYQYSSYKIFVAEVASIVNELLLSHYLLENSKDKSEKLSILNHMMETFRTTLYRQTMFAEFERLMFDKREQGEALTSKFISENYYQIVEKYFGKDVVVDDLIKYEWARIPHFYYDFYVYKYATGLSAACYIVSGIINKKQGALKNYLSFLKTGGSKYPIEALKVAGVDMNDSKVVESAIKMFDDTIDEFTKIYNS